MPSQTVIAANSQALAGSAGAEIAATDTEENPQELFKARD
jgi:hypothetical protein